MGKGFARGITRFATWLYRRSGGKIGGSMRGASVLLLTTIGRKSGKVWTVPLIYQPDGDRFVLIASAGGAPKHPTWWLNLQAHPDTTVQLGRETLPVHASEATGPDRDRLWQLMVAAFSGYADYEKKTSRQIPVVVLERR